jgi:hypothetical protein
MAKGEGRESPCPDAVTATTVKDVTTTERSGNAEALLHIMIQLSEALPNGMLLNKNANGMTSLRKDGRRRDVCFVAVTRLRTL